MTNNENKSLRKNILWVLLIPVIAIVLSVIIGVAIAGFEPHLIRDVFRAQWILFLSVFVIVSILGVLTIWRPKGIAVTALLVIALVFILSSAKGNPIAETMRAYINGTFDINLLLGAVTVMALALAIATISKNSKKEDSKDI